MFMRAGLPPDEVGAMSVAAACAARGVDRAGLEHELVHAIEESAPFSHGAFEWDVRRDQVELSPPLASLLGTTQHETSPSRLLRYVHPDDQARIGAVFASVATHPRAVSFECRVRREDGAMRIFAARMEPLCPDSPVLVGIIWDITEQRLPGLEPGLALPLLHSTLEATADGILVVDRSGNITAYNQRFLSLWHIPAEVVVKGTDEALLQNVLDQLRDPTGFLDQVHTLYASPERESFDQIAFRDGRVYDRYSRPQRLEFAIVGRVWSFRDVTERERLIAQMEFLSDVNRLFASLDLASALDTTAKLAVPFLGEACAIDVFDEARHPTVSQALDPARRYAPELRPEVRGGVPAMYAVDGRSEIAAPLCFRKEVIGAIVVSAPLAHRHTRADLDVLVHLADCVASAVANARLVREAQDALHARDEFLAIAAHELRGPVSAIHMGVQTLRRGVIADRIRDATLEIVEREDRRLARFADDITEITRIRAGVLPFHDEQVDLNEVTSDVVSRMAIAIERSGSTVSFAPGEPVIGRWDRVRLDQVVANLLDNALKFGLGNPIELATAARDGTATLTVRDHGLGIPPAQREAIFEPFTRAVSVRHYGGLGLGLFIVRTIVVRYGGTVEVAPAEGGGSRFVVRLPQGSSA